MRRRKRASRKRSYPRMRAGARRVGRRIKRGGKILGMEMAPVLGAGVYGGFRARVSNYLAPYTSRIPLGNISDEIGMIVVSMGLKRFVGRKVPLVKEIAKAGILIESARIGEAIATGAVGMGGTASNGGGSMVIG